MSREKPISKIITEMKSDETPKEDYIKYESLFRGRI